jgi:hypothetical protein
LAAGILHDALVRCRLGVDQTGSHELGLRTTGWFLGLSLKSNLLPFHVENSP